MKINIDKFQLSDIYNLKFEVFYPLTKFVSKKQFVNICNKMEVEKNTFFPIPLYFSLKTSIKKIKVYFKDIYVCHC